MQRQLKKLVEKYGPVSIATLFHFKDTNSITKWKYRGVPDRHKARLKLYAGMTHKQLKKEILTEHERRLDLCGN